MFQQTLADVAQVQISDSAPVSWALAVAVAVAGFGMAGATLRRRRGDFHAPA